MSATRTGGPSFFHLCDAVSSEAPQSPPLRSREDYMRVRDAVASPTSWAPQGNARHDIVPMDIEMWDTVLVE